MSDAARFAADVDDVLLYLTESSRICGCEPRDLRVFDGALPCFDGNGASWGNLSGPWESIVDDVSPSDVRGLDIAILIRAPSIEKTPIGHVRFTLMRTRECSSKMARGHSQRIWPITYEHSCGLINEHGRFGVRRWFYGSDGRSWYDDAGRSKDLRVEAAMFFSRRYEWNVSLALDDGPAIRLPTTPDGVREVFRLRDIPNGRTRRSALRHWVAEHWRRCRMDPAESKRVRAHLRGETRFIWNGLRCEVHPSRFDEEQSHQPRASANNGGA